MDLVWAIAIGMAAGFLAGVLMKGSGFGLLGNLIVGALGALLGNFLFRVLGLYPGNVLGQLVAATVGAIVLIVLIGVALRKKA